MSMLAIATNIMGINTHRNLKTVSGRSEKASEKLSSGFKVNRAADDAAGLAISEKMRNQIKGLNQANRNVEDGISLIQTAEGGIQEISEMVKRQRELIIQAMNDTNSDSDREKIQTEINQLREEINSTAEKTQFNGIQLLYGVSDIEYDFENFIGTMSATVPAGSIMEFAFLNFNASPADGIGYNGGDPPHDSFSIFFRSSNNQQVPILNVTAPNEDVFSIDISDNTTFDTDYARISTGGNIVQGSDRATFLGCFPLSWLNADESTGKWIIAFDNTLGTDDIELEFTTDYPATSCSFQTKSTPLYIQSGANENQGMYIDRYDCRTVTLGIANIVVKPREAAEASLGDLDNSIEIINSYRAKAGSQQNRLEHTSKNLLISSENLSSSESRIRDTDMAKEMMEYTKSNILSQAGMSMLAQANQAPQNVLSLIR